MVSKNSSDKPRKLPVIGDDLRDRISVGTEQQDIGKLWEEQKRQRAEDKLLDRELRNAKKLTKELKKKLRRNYLETQWTFAKKRGLEINRYFLQIKKNKYYNQLKLNTRKLFRYLSLRTPKFLKNSKAFMPTSGVIIVFIVAVILASGSNQSPGTLGDLTSSPSVAGQNTSETRSDNNLPKETPKFDLLYPIGKNAQDFETVKISPSTEQTPQYTFIDRLGDAQLNITQQQLPQNFVGNIDSALVNLANSFQATDIFQVDNTKIYHGYTERNGGVQSLIFVKNNLLIFISSDQKLPEDSWAGYVASLN